MNEDTKPQAGAAPIETAKRAWVEPQLEVTPIEDTAGGPSGPPNDEGLSNQS